MQKQYLIKFSTDSVFKIFLGNIKHENIIVLTEILVANIIDNKTLTSVGGKECILLTFFTSIFWSS